MKELYILLYIYICQAWIVTARDERNPSWISLNWNFHTGLQESRAPQKCLQYFRDCLKLQTYISGTRSSFFRQSNSTWHKFTLSNWKILKIGREGLQERRAESESMNFHWLSTRGNVRWWETAIDRVWHGGPKDTQCERRECLSKKKARIANKSAPLVTPHNSKQSLSPLPEINSQSWSCYVRRWSTLWSLCSNRLLNFLSFRASLCSSHFKGLSAKDLALSFAFGITGGLVIPRPLMILFDMLFPKFESNWEFPVPGTTTLVCLVFTYLFSLNPAATQIINLMLTPVNFALLIPLYLSLFPISNVFSFFISAYPWETGYLELTRIFLPFLTY